MGPQAARRGRREAHGPATRPPAFHLPPTVGDSLGGGTSIMGKPPRAIHDAHHGSGVTSDTRVPGCVRRGSHAGGGRPGRVWVFPASHSSRRGVPYGAEWVLARELSIVSSRGQAGEPLARGVVRWSTVRRLRGESGSRGGVAGPAAQLTRALICVARCVGCAPKRPAVVRAELCRP
jgi:hypothetical protein